MANLKIRYLTVALLLLAVTFMVSGLSYDRYYDEKAGLKDLQTIPMQIGDWRGEDFPLEEKIYEILETRAIIHRSYKNMNGSRVFLSLVHYHDAKVDFHAPEACLGGRGLKTVKTTRQLTLVVGGEKISVDVAEIVSTKENGRDLTYYFYEAGQYLGCDYIKMRLSLAANKLANHDARASLVRISTTMIPDRKEAENRLNNFMTSLLPCITTFTQSE
jgi:EpsI family protein